MAELASPNLPPCSFACAPLILSAPFGNYCSFSGMTRTYGTFTLAHRGGWPRRLWRCALTLRYSWRMQSWRNKLGLPNPGIRTFLQWWNAGVVPAESIVSVHGWTAAEWTTLAHLVLTQTSCAVELNVSCPNVEHGLDLTAPLSAVMLDPARCIIKLPPLQPVEVADLFYAAGVRMFHACNTLWTPGGGLSGAVLKPYSLAAVVGLRSRFGSEVRVIGGGGVRTMADVCAYRTAGADHVALGSVLLNPLRWRRVAQMAHGNGEA